MISEIDERIKEIYDVLEKEAIAKNYVESHVPSYQKALEEVAATFSETKTEVDYLKQTYYLDDGDMEKYMSIEKKQSIIYKHNMRKFLTHWKMKKGHILRCESVWKKNGNN